MPDVPITGAVIGLLIFKFRWLVLIVWLGTAAILLALIPPADQSPGETSDLLPSDTPVHVALDLLTRHFGEKAALSEADIVFERPDAPLNQADFEDIEGAARSLGAPLPSESIDAELRQITLRTPATLAALTLSGQSNPLISQDHHAALVTISLPYNFITKPSARLAQHFQRVMAARPLRTGIITAVTGSAGYGYDYAVATERSHQKTMLVTLVAVIVILLLIYRAPLAAMIPLVGVSMAALIVLNLLTALEKFGLHSGMAERIFTFVLLYGAGIDYSLLFISRYREFLDAGRSHSESTAAGLNASIVAIGSSTLMTAAGLAMLCLARFSVFRHAGPAVVIALFMSALAAATLVPAILAIVGPRAFWPGRKQIVATSDSTGDLAQRSRFWSAIANLVTGRPLTVLVITVTILILPAVGAIHIDWNYDSLYSLKPTYQARRGTEMVERHWPVGQIAPITALLVAEQSQTAQTWETLNAKIVDAIKSVRDVDDVRSMQSPLGMRVRPFENSYARWLAPADLHLSPDGKAMRLAVVLSVPPLVRPAMADLDTIAAAVDKAIAGASFRSEVHFAGGTAEMMDIRSITQADFHRIAGLTLAVILVLITVVLREVPMAFFIVAATVLSYLATVGLSCAIFGLLGSSGLEWKVQMLLFIVLVAVGQDYSIFFAIRFAQEARSRPIIEATRRAVIFTGPVISSCGLIMAATLGSIMAGDVQLLVQLGFSFALGMMIDTFLVRPLLLPAFIVLTGTTLKNALAIEGTDSISSPALAEPATAS